MAKKAKGKQWYASKTIWANVVSLIGVFAANAFGVTISPKETAAILVVINLILRAVTKEPLRFD